MSISLSGLNDTHADQIEAYIRFARSKKREHCSEVKGAFDDAKDMKLLEDMYSQEDAHRILRDIRDSVHVAAKDQLNLYGRMSALYLQEVFKQAEAKNISMKIDFSKLDDAIKLAGIEKILGHDDKEMSGNKLQSIGGGGVDTNLVEQIKDWEAKNGRLQRDFEDTTDKIKRELKYNVQLKLDIAAMREQVRDARRDYDNTKEGNEKAMGQELDDLTDDLARAKRNNSEVELEKELEKIKSELAGRIADSTQFRQLKLMIQAKNTQIKELRNR